MPGKNLTDKKLNNLLIMDGTTDKALGNNENDTIVGTANNDIMFGNDGDDIFIVNGGNDDVNGGNGIDSIVIKSDPSSYQFFHRNGNTFQILSPDNDLIT